MTMTMTMTISVTSAGMTTMTESRAPKRDKHPARSARILTSGLALSSTLGLTAAYTWAAQAKALNENSLSTPAVAADPVLVPSGSVAQSPVTAPTAPAGAKPIVIEVPVAAPAAEPAPAGAPAPVATVAPQTSSSN